MSYQPPPPGGPPPPPPGQWGPPPGAGRPAFDPKSVNPLDWAILGAGFLTFIFSFFDWYGFEDTGCGKYCVSLDENAWNGFFGWFAVFLAVVGAALVAMSLFAPQVKLPISNRLAGLGAFGLATLFMILAIFVDPSYDGVDVPDSVDTSRDFGFWIALILVIAGLVLSLMRLQQSGEKLPGALGGIPNIGARGPQGGSGGGQPQAPGYGPPPTPGYGQPPAPGYGPPQQPGPGYGPPPGGQPPQAPPPPPGYGQQ